MVVRGLNGLLKRSERIPSKVKKRHPPNIRILETLNVFGIKADYMKEFEEYLRSEDIIIDRIKEIDLKIKLNKEFLNKGLVTLELEEGINFKNDICIQLNSNESVVVEVDLRPRVEKLTSYSPDIKEKDDLGTTIIEEKYINLCNWDRIFLEIVKYKRTRGFWNLMISKDVLKNIIKKEKYILYCNPSDVKPEKFTDIEKLESIIITILKSYINSFYRNNRLKYEDEYLVYEKLEEDDGNFKDYVIKVKEKDQDLIDYIMELIDSKRIYSEEFNGVKGVKNVYFDRHLFQPQLCQSDRVKSTPVGLDNNERDFIVQLKRYVKTGEFREICEDKEYLY